MVSDTGRETTRPRPWGNQFSNTTVLPFVVFKFCRCRYTSHTFEPATARTTTRASKYPDRQQRRNYCQDYYTTARMDGAKKKE